MPLNPLVNRYRDLITLVPEGLFYGFDGTVVPFRDSPYVFRFTTDAPNRQFGVFLNNIFQGVVNSDALGNLTVSVKLMLGENTLEVVDGFTQERTKSVLTARNYATWLAAYAQEFERLDDNIDTIRLDSTLEECFSSDLETVWGTRVDQPNPGYDTETYRELLQRSAGHTSELQSQSNLVCR